jgi:hypothetical protein
VITLDVWAQIRCRYATGKISKRELTRELGFPGGRGVGGGPAGGERPSREMGSNKLKRRRVQSSEVFARYLRGFSAASSLTQSGVSAQAGGP